MGAHDDEISPMLVRHAYDCVRRKGIASDLLGWHREAGGDEYIRERHDHSSLLTRV
jgi:hypothetical protein